MGEALDYLVFRNLNYRVEYKWVFPNEAQEMKKSGWVELRERRAVAELLKVPSFGEMTDAPPQDFEFIYQVKMCRETLYDKTRRWP